MGRHGGPGHPGTKDRARSLPSSAAFMVPPAGGAGRKVSPLPQTAAGGPSGNLEGTGKLVLGIHAAAAAAASSRRRSGSWRGEQPPAGSLVGPLPRRHARGRAQRREPWGGGMREVCKRGRPACCRDSPRVLGGVCRAREPVPSRWDPRGDSAAQLGASRAHSDAGPGSAFCLFKAGKHLPRFPPARSLPRPLPAVTSRPCPPESARGPGDKSRSAALCARSGFSSLGKRGALV